MEADVSDLPLPEEEQFRMWIQRAIDKGWIYGNTPDRLKQGKDTVRLRPSTADLVTW